MYSKFQKDIAKASSSSNNRGIKDIDANSTNFVIDMNKLQQLQRERELVRQKSAKMAINQ